MRPSRSTAPFRLLLGCLAVLSAVAVVQQQVLLRRPPRLQAVSIQPIRSGAAALDVVFSRPMDQASVAESVLDPDLAHRWFGGQDRLRLLIAPQQAVQNPLRLDVLGRDLRQLALPPHQLWWDPRPHLLAVVPTTEGESLQMRLRDGQWRPLAPEQRTILQIEPLGNGAGVALVSDDDEARQRVLFRALDQRALSERQRGLGDPELGVLEELESGAPGSLLFAHLSSNQRGDLLVQLGGFDPEIDRIWIQSEQQKTRALELEPSGALRLLPDGSGLVMLSYDGLELLSLDGLNEPSMRQSLPGRRELKAFCSGSGRALLIRHWPDYRRSIELVIPSRPPREVWLGEAGVMAAACDTAGDRLWVVLREAGRGTEDRLLLLDSEGNQLTSRALGEWRLTSGAELDYDPVSNRLLTVVKTSDASSGRVALIDANSLELEVLNQPAVLARWLPAGGTLSDVSPFSR